ncbi:hypothetical protein JXM83_02320 [Candidatus Woesearchaeota archaeon]|nr:hypothetical protein [Candidatus Woesearchaeota archaeon]
MLKKEIRMINSLEELDNLKFTTKIKGIQIKASLLKNTKISNINYISIILDEIIEISQNIFTELIIPYKNFSEELIENLKGINRVIIEFNKEEQTKNLDEISAILIAKRFFPFTKGIPFCHAKIDQAIELFQRPKITNKKECQNCVYINYCNNNNFTSKPILKEKEEILKFLKENEDTANRI